MTKNILLLILILTTAEVQSKQMKQNAHKFEFNSIDGGVLALQKFDNKVLLIVNTASHCGFTPQYNDLQNLWDQYKDKGLVVIGVPSGDFGNQELDSNVKIKNFCKVNFNVNFPMASRSHIKGQKAHPFYKWANKQVGFTGRPRWNFHKFLIGPQGHLVDWFASTTKPTSTKIKSKVEEQLSLIRKN